MFEPKHKLDAVGEPNEMTQEHEPANQLDQSDDAGNETQFAASLVESLPSDSSQNQHDYVGPIAQAKRPSTKRPARKAATRIGNNRSGKHANGASGESRKGPFAAFVEAPVDELAALDAENRRLKGLLIQQLRQENLQLRTMLRKRCAAHTSTKKQFFDGLERGRNSHVIVFRHLRCYSTSSVTSEVVIG